MILIKYILLIVFSVSYAHDLIDIGALSSHPIRYIIQPYVEVIKIYISNSSFLKKLLLKGSKLHPEEEDLENYYYDYLEQITAELSMLKGQIQKEIEVSPYPSKFKLKMPSVPIIRETSLKKN